jgi:hypothetical protein
MEQTTPERELVERVALACGEVIAAELGECGGWLATVVARAAIEATGIQSLLADKAKLEAGLPQDWAFWLDDAASILRENGTVDHANAVRDAAIVLRAILNKEVPNG